MKAEFEEAVAYLERWYDWRDKQISVYADESNSWVHTRKGWLAQTAEPDHPVSDRFFFRDVYRYDLFQWEDADRGNSNCEYPTRGECYCGVWPGFMMTLPWTAEDENRWLIGDYYTECEDVFHTPDTAIHLQDRYGIRVYGVQKPNDVIAVIEPGDDNAPEKARADGDAPSSGQQRDKGDAGGPDGNHREHTSGASSESGTTRGSTARVGSDLRQYVTADES